MKKFVLSGLCCAGLVALLPAHGGQYRGPGDVVPPSPGGGGRTGGPGGPSTGGPAGPSAPAPSGPATGGPAGPTTGGPTGPAGGRGPTTGGRGAAIEDDLSTWNYWWEFNKDPFIRLKDAVGQGGIQTGSDDFYLGSTRKAEAKDSMRPTDLQIANEILPALKKAIDSTEQRDINSSCMIAMAKIGKNHTDFNLVDVFVPRLKKLDQEVRETAALAIGIAAIAGEKEMDILVDLALDKDKGRAATGGSVDVRTRAFATYGLGLTAYKTTNVEIKRRAFETMKSLLEAEKASDRQILVAAINGMSILNIGTGSDAEKALLADAVSTLEKYYLKPLGSGEQLMQSHCPNAIAKLIGRDHERVDHFKELFAADLQDKQEKSLNNPKRASIFISASCAQALGMLCKPFTDKDDKKCPDGKYSELLLKMWHDHKDPQTRNFSMMSLGLIGGSLNKEAMFEQLKKGQKDQQKPWCAMAIGVCDFFEYEAQVKAGKTLELDGYAAKILTEELKEARTPSLTGALGIALGLVQAKEEAADEMRARLKSNIEKEEMAGYLCIGLALMNDVASKEDINKVVDQSVRRTELLQQAAIALGKLGDKKVADKLQSLLTEGEPNLAKLSAIASALGFIGDSRTIKPLKDLLFDSKLQDLSRAFAAVALGGVADKESLPWNSKIGTNLNYRAAVDTLTNKSTGILDIL
jgi:HEAT repeat protein